MIDCYIAYTIDFDNLLQTTDPLIYISFCFYKVFPNSSGCFTTFRAAIDFSLSSALSKSSSRNYINLLEEHNPSYWKAKFLSGVFSLANSLKSLRVGAFQGHLRFNSWLLSKKILSIFHQYQVLLLFFFYLFYGLNFQTV